MAARAPKGKKKFSTQLVLAEGRIVVYGRREAQTIKSLPPEEPPEGPLACHKNISTSLFPLCRFDASNLNDAFDVLTRQ